MWAGDQHAPAQEKAARIERRARDGCEEGGGSARAEKIASTGGRARQVGNVAEAAAGGLERLAAMSVLGKCTGCSVDALADKAGGAHVHPKLGVLLCERCYDRDTRVFELDVRNHVLCPAMLVFARRCSRYSRTLNLTVRDPCIL